MQATAVKKSLSVSLQLAFPRSRGRTFATSASAVRECRRSPSILTLVC